MKFMKPTASRFVLISVLCILTSASFAGDWGAFEKFKVTVNGYEVSYAFCECDIAMLNEQIPQAALDYVYGVSADEQGNTVHNKTGLLLRDFTLKYWTSLDGTKAVVLLGAQEYPAGRRMPVGLEQIQMWAQYLSAYGYTPDKWMTKEQALELIGSAAYTEDY